MPHREIYCNNCKKQLGKYNAKYFTENGLGELLNNLDSMHIIRGHAIEIRLINYFSNTSQFCLEILLEYSFLPLIIFLEYLRSI